MKMSMNLWWLSIFHEHNLYSVWIFVPYIHTQTTMKMSINLGSWRTHAHKYAPYVTWVKNVPGMTHAPVRHAIHVHVCKMAHSCVQNGTFMCATWRMRVCNMAHSCGQPGAFRCAAWHSQVCGMTHASVQCDVLMWMSWLIHICDMKHACECITRVWAHHSPLSQATPTIQNKINKK